MAMAITTSTRGPVRKSPSVVWSASRFTSCLSVLAIPRRARNISHHDMKSARRRMTDSDYQRLAGFRFMLRQFLDFSAQAARAQGLTPPQHQALLVIRALAPAN